MASEFSGPTFSDLVFLVPPSAPPLIRPSLHTGPHTRTDLPSNTDPVVGSFQALPGPGPHSDREVLAGAAPCWSVKPWDKALPGLRPTMGSTSLAGEAQDSIAPRAVSVPLRSQGGMAQGPSVLSDLGKASVPALGLCSH